MTTVIFSNVTLLCGFGLCLLLLIFLAFSEKKDNALYIIFFIGFGGLFIYAICLGAALLDLGLVSLIFMIPLLISYKQGGRNEL